MMVSVTAGSALWGCGSDERSGAVERVSVSAGTKSGLGTVRFRALDAILVASLPLDRFRSTAVDPATFAAAARPVRAACDALDVRDGWLRQIKRSCRLTLDIDEHIIVFSSECPDGASATERLLHEDACRRSIQPIPGLLRRIRRQARGSDRAIRNARLTPACQRALKRPAGGDEIYGSYSRAFGLLAQGARTRSRRDLEEGWRLLVAADAENQDLPSAKENLHEFRSGCA
jgi:hypothetical protein